MSFLLLLQRIVTSLVAYNNTNVLHYGSGEYKSGVERAGRLLPEALERAYVLAAHGPCAWSLIAQVPLTPPSLTLTLLPPLLRTLVRTSGPPT